MDNNVPNKYLVFPLSLLQYIRDDNDKEGLFKVITFAAMRFSEKINYKPETVARQIIYLFYRRPDFLTQEIRKKLETMIEGGHLVEDENYYGFAGTSFNPEPETKAVMTAYNDDESFLRDCISVYRQHQALELLGLPHEHINYMRECYKETSEDLRIFEAKHGADAWASVSTKTAIEVFNAKLFMDYLRLIAAVSSIIGKRNFNSTVKSVLLDRMFGCKKHEILMEYLSKYPEVNSKYEFLLRRRRWEYLIKSGKEQGYFSYWSTGRKFYVSIKLKEPEILKSVIKRTRIPDVILNKL